MHKKDIIFGIMLTVFLIIFLSPFASKQPDSLEKIARDKGFLGKETRPGFKFLMPEYIFPGIKNEQLATIASGVAGVIIIFIVAYLFAALLKRQKHH